MVPWLIGMNSFPVVCPTEGPCEMWKGVREVGLHVNVQPRSWSVIV